jgi:hypothetical protein
VRQKSSLSVCLPIVRRSRRPRDEGRKWYVVVVEVTYSRAGTVEDRKRLRSRAR